MARRIPKGDEIEDLRKAVWYINRKIETLQRSNRREKLLQGPGT